MGELAATPSKLPFRLSSTAATYASSASTSLSAYADLLGHHLRSTLDLITTPPVSSYPEDPTSGDDEWAGANFFGCGDLEIFMRFLEASNYCLGYSDSDDGGYDLSRECFNLEVGGSAPDAQGGVAPSERRNATPPPNTTPTSHPGALLGILNANRKICKRTDTDVAFTWEYSRVSIFHRERECTN